MPFCVVSCDVEMEFVVDVLREVLASADAKGSPDSSQSLCSLGQRQLPTIAQRIRQADASRGRLHLLGRFRIL